MATEKRLIAYDPIAFGEFTQSLKNTLEVYDPYSDGYEDGVERVEDWLEFNAVLDAMEVVRCKDCKHLGIKDFVYGCCNKKMIGIVQPDDFCSFGERKDNENSRNPSV